MNLSRLLGGVLALTLMMCSQNVDAADYNLVISGAHTGSIVLTAGDPGSPSTVTAASGTFDGQTVTGVSNSCGSNNTINANGQFGFVTNLGISIHYGTGSDYVNFWSYPVSYGNITIASVNCLSFDNVTPSWSLLTATPVPTVSGWAMIIMSIMLCGFALIQILRQRTAPS